METTLIHVCLLTLVGILKATTSPLPPLKLETVYPIQFTEVTSQAYVYSNILSLNYVEPYILEEDEITRLVEEAFSTLHACGPTDTICNTSITENSLTILKTTKELVLQEARSAMFELKHDIEELVRHKRGFGHWIGSLLHSWCDVATMDDLADIMKSNADVAGQLNSFRMLINSEHENLTKFSSSIDERMSESMQDLLKVADETTVRSALRSRVTYMITHYNKIHDACNRRVIPSNAMDIFTLSAELARIQTELEAYGTALAIPLDAVEDYYKLRICTCQFVDNAIKVTIRFPIKPKNAAFRLYTPINLPFKFQNQICSVQTKDAIVIENTVSKTVHISSAQYLKDCDLSTHLCKLHPSHYPSIDAICLHETFQRKSTDELRGICPFVCTEAPRDMPLINRLKPGEYVITNVPDNSYVENSAGELTELPFSADLNGAFFLTLPCSARLIRNVYWPNGTLSHIQTFIDKLVPCSDDDTYNMKGHVLKPIMPVQWASNTFNSSSSASSSLNSKWKRWLPNYSFMSQAEFESRLHKIEFVDMPKIRERTSSIFLSYELTDKVYFYTIILYTIAVPFIIFKIRSLGRRSGRLETVLLMRPLNAAGTALASYV